MAREMKDSGIAWIGEIPINWETTKIKYFYDCYDGKRVPVDSAKRKKGPYPYWGAGSITDYVDSYLFDEEIILLGEDGAPFFDYTRPVAFLINEKVWVNNHIHVLKPKETVNSHFLVHYLNNVDYKSYINGSILNKLTQSNMNSIAFVVPPINEQQRIANFLDKECARIDSVIELTRQSIEEYKKLKQSIITEAVTKGIRPNRPMKDSGIEWIGDIPEDWARRKLKSFTSIISKGATPKEMENEFTIEKPIRFLKSENIVGNQLSENPLFTIDKETNDNLLKRSQLEKNDILFVIAGASIGKVAIMKNHLLPSNTNQAVCFIRMRKEHISKIKFMWYTLQSDLMKTYISINSVQSAQPNISMEDIGNYYITIPPDNEQKRIISYLDAKCSEIDNLIANKEKIITELETYKKSLIYEFVTGKKEV